MNKLKVEEEMNDGAYRDVKYGSVFSCADLKH